VVGGSPVRRGLLVLGTAVLLALALPAYGQDLQKGLDAHHSGDYATALREWRPLAEQGDAWAQYNLAVMYAEGEGVLEDYAEAVRLYRLAAEQGDAWAQFNLGLMYYNGHGVPKDDAEAVRLYRLAAEQGHAGAQSNLGVMYRHGYGVPQDYVQAHMWFNLAAAQGDEDAAGNRDIVAGWMTPAKIMEAQRLAREWLEPHQ
jgi:hypothetical protein